jgi:hypothetical protein
MDIQNFLVIGFLVVIWWVGLWGMIEIAIHEFARGSVKKAFFVYASMVSFVILIILTNPTITEHFL